MRTDCVPARATLVAAFNETVRTADPTKLIDTLEDNDDVQSVSHNAEIPESVSI